MRLYDSILGQVENVDIRLDFPFKGDLLDPVKNCSVFWIPVFPLRFPEAMNCLQERVSYKFLKSELHIQ